MTIALPEAVEPFLADDVEWSQPGVYALVLEKPDELTQAWGETFDHRPPYLDELEEAETVVYVGAAKNVMHRLEDHNRRDKRKAALLEVCEIDHLRNVWWMDSVEHAFERESGIAIQMSNHNPDYYVHQR